MEWTQLFGGPHGLLPTIDENLLVSCKTFAMGETYVTGSLEAFALGDLQNWCS